MEAHGKRVPDQPTLRVAFGISSENGRRGGVPKTNQDRCFVRMRLLGSMNMHLFGIADGHGPSGHHVAGFVADVFPRNFEASIAESDTLAALASQGGGAHDKQLWERETFPALARAANAACRRTQDDLFADDTIDSSTSGTTLVALLFVHGQALVVAVGDSAAYIFREEKGGAGGALSGYPLSVAHKPSHPPERRRVEALGGRVGPRVDPYRGPTGPARVWSPALGWKGPGLAMSRSLGDAIASDVGVICDPLVVSQALRRAGDAWILLASDGLSDALGTKEIARVLARCATVEEASSALLDAAKDKWLGSSKCDTAYVDDISVVVLSLDAARHAARA